MGVLQPKKLIIMNILDILKKYTDEDHRLSQKEIAEILETEYEMKVDRKAVKRNLMNLIEFGYEIEYSEAVRMVKNKKGELEESVILSDFYLVRDFTDAELRLLVDSLLFSKHIPYSQCKELIEKIEGLSNRYFRSKVRHIRNLPENMLQNKELFYTIEVLDEAISKGRQVAFKYNNYSTDKKQYPRKDSEGKAREYIVNPYQMVATNGRYYLVCNYDKYDNSANYRVDRITGIRLLDTPVKPMKKVKGLENGLDLPKHMAEHIYMFSDETERVQFRAKKYIISEIIDWFGKDVNFTDETEDEVTAEVKVSRMAMKFWAMQYAEHITVTSPETLADEIGNTLRTAAEKYRK
ncbi:MAG: WYL domain-containing protein [Clostridia bacterium]|nr:WYL domain-containing protein [Clostridia bacterium]